MLTSVFAAVDGRAEPAEAPAAIGACADCHGPAGVATKPGTPHLNGQLKDFLAETMSRFANGRRPTDIAQHKDFAAADIDAAAAFYAAQSAAGRPAQQVDPAAVSKGETIYNDRCADCHMDSGRDSDKDAALLAGQDKDFLVSETLKFKTGSRKFPFKMDEAYRGLSDEDLAAAAQYFAAQQPVAPAVKKKRRR